MREIASSRNFEAGVPSRILRALAFAALIAAALLTSQAGAQDFAALEHEFDARGLTMTEKRVLQLGLTLDRSYRGLLDGRWGSGSQGALERFVAKTDRHRLDALVHNYHAAALAGLAFDFIVANELVYRGGAYGHRLLTPSGEFYPDGSTEADDLVLYARGLEIRTLWSGTDLALALHERAAADIYPHQEPYLVRNRNRLVSARGTGAERIYLRSDLVPELGNWVTTLVREMPGADPRLFEVVVAGITLDADAEIDAPNGRLVELVRLGVEMVRAAQHPAPRSGTRIPVATPSGLAPEDMPAGGSGTAFFVNNTDLVTAGHVVDGCASVAFVDGTPLEVVARHPVLDLALLASPRRSRDWIPVHLTGKARLGQQAFVLGYPYFGAIGTALNMSGGHVSALAGLGDDAGTITISAPVQPGNSGGPLLARDGTVIGVVVARLDKLVVAEATGSLPENINYAVTGEELLAFLEAEDVSLPRAEGEAVSFGDGIPESVQRSVVPIICSGS
jgi:serine protease Do